MTHRVLWLEAPGGAAGDMLLAALLDAGAPEAAVLHGLRALGIEGWRFEREQTLRCGVTAGRVKFVPEAREVEPSPHTASLRVRGAPQPTVLWRASPSPDAHDHSHDHGHVHHHDHGADEPTFRDQPHRSWRAIRTLLQEASLSESVKTRALSVFSRLAGAEARVHGMSPDDVTFHEVGSVDAILDIVGVCLAIDALHIDTILTGPLPVARGFVRCAHGRLPVPAPATLYLLEGSPVVPGIEGFEQVTPTGAALWTTLGTPGAAPAMTIQAIGYGAGSRDTPGQPNVVRAVIGTQPGIGSTVDVLACQMDDITGEHLAPLFGLLLNAGALDVTFTPVWMKKNRTGVKVEVICRSDKRLALTDILLRHGSTFGVRHHTAERVELERHHKTVETPFGPVRLKIGHRGSDVYHVAPEHEDVATCAQNANVPVAVVFQAAIRAWDPEAR